MTNYLSDLLTDHQGHVDEQALLSIFGALVFFGLEIFSVIIRGENFDPFGFGAGMGTLLGATSAGFGLRARWTPDMSPSAPINPVTGRIMGGF